jgi:hypothetical protein
VKQVFPWVVRQIFPGVVAEFPPRIGNPCIIDIFDIALRVGRPDGLRQRAGKRSKSFFAFLEGIFNPFTLTDIRTIAGEELSSPVNEPGHIHQARKLTPVAPQMLEFEQVTALFARDSQPRGKFLA